MKKIISTLLLLLFISGLKAQMSGVYAVPSTFTSIAAAISSLNAVGVSGAVTINISAGYTETAPVGGYTIGVITGASATNSIVIQKSGAGVNPLITAFTGTATPGSAIQDGVISLVGTDFLTIDGISIVDPNSTNPATMEYGIGLFRASATDGCQNNTIQNCSIILNRVNNAAGTAPAIDGSRAINSVNSLLNTQTTALTITSAAGTNSNNRFYSNFIHNCNSGIALMGYAAASPFTAADANNDIGGATSVTSNTIINFGGGGTTSAANGIRTLAQYGLNISNNLINNNDGVTFGGGIDHAAVLTAINIGAATSANETITNNTITVRGGGTTQLMTGILNAAGSTAASNVINISNNLLTNCTYTTATTAVFNAILNSATAATLSIVSNTVNNVLYSGTGTGVLIETGSPVTAFTNSNVITGVNRTGASGSFRIIKTTSPTNWFCNNNNITNIIWSNLSSTGSFDGIYSLSSAVNVTMTANTIQNIGLPGTGTGNGIREFGVTGLKLFQNNTVNNFTTVAGGAGGTTFNGISLSTGSITAIGNTVNNLNVTGGSAGSIVGILVSGGTNANLSKNRLGGFSSSSTGAVITGINLTGGTSYSISNNVIGDFSAPLASGPNVLIGMNLSSGSTQYVYYNSINLSGTSSGATFGSSGILAGTSASLDLRNNIIVNNSIPVGGALSVAYRRSSTTLSTYVASSNNNLFYAGLPSSTSLLFYDGTNAIQNIVNYKVFVGGRDLQSVTENPVFISSIATNANFLNPSTSNPTQIEGGASTIGFIADDYVGSTRNISTPDIGAWEGNFPTANCTGVPGANIAATTVFTTCPGGTANLYLANNYTVTGLTYQWLASTTGSTGPYFAISGATTAVISQSIATTTWFQAEIACSNSGGTVAATPVVVNSGINPTSALITATSVCPGTSVQVNLSSTSSNYSYQWMSSSTGTAGPFSPVANATLAAATITNILASAWFQAAVSCSSGPTFSILTNIVSTGTVNSPGQCLAYCQASATSTADDEIFNVSIGTLNNTSNCSSIAGPGSVPGQYSNYTSILAAPVLSTSLSYPLAVTVGMCNTTSYSGIVTAFIDFNQNGLFTDPGELVYTSPYTAFAISGTQVSTVITIPANALTGLTRMRIIELESSTPAPPCGTFSWGEVEDYVVSINNPPSCTGTPASNTVVVNPALVCSGGNTNFSLANSYSVSGITYQWASATSSAGPYVPISGATLTTISATNITGSLWYQAEITCTASTNSITAQPAFVSLLGPPQYANVPFIENFDAQWQNRCDNRNVPVANYWSSNPSTGNNSWRRQDDGGTAIWTSATIGTVAPLTGAGCADFHSYYAGSGTTGDLRVYLNMSNPAPSYSLSFYYYNSSGTDSLEVLLSTNGGSTFSKVGGYKLATAWNKKIINLGAINSSSCVISFSATSDFGATDIAIDSMEVKTCPNLVIAQTPTAACAGSLTALSVTGGSTYVWSNSVTGTSISITPTTATVYSVTGSNGMCAVTATFNAQVLPSPVINISGSSGICTGQTATLTASGANTYTWTGGIVSNSITPTPITATIYTVTGTDVLGCVNSATQNITVAASLSISIVGPSTVCVGSAATMTAQGGVTYSWNTGASSATVAPIVTANSVFTVIGSSGTCSNSAVQSISIVALPTVAITGNTVVCAGKPTTLIASGATSYSWSTSSTSNSISVSPTVTTLYTVSGNSLGCNASQTISVLSNTNPVIAIASSTASVCFSTSVSYTASGAATYTWVNGPQTANASYTPTASTVYTVNGTNAAGCAGSKTVALTIIALPSVVISPASATVCNGSLNTFTASGASTYTWNGNIALNTNTFQTSPTANAVYTVSANNAQGCFNTQTVAVTTLTLPIVLITPPSLTVCSTSLAQFTASGANTYSWSTGALTAGLIIAPVSNSIVLVKGFDINGCTNTSTVAITTLSLPVVVITPSFATVCSQSTASFTASGAISYTWSNAVNTTTTSFTPTVSSQYFVSGSNAEGCVSNTPLTVITITLPALQITKPSGTVCANASGNYTATGADTFTWSTGLNGNIIAITPTSNSVYSVSGTNTITTCVGTQTFAVSTFSSPIIIINPSASQSVCINGSTTYTASGANTFSWSNGAFGPVLQISPTVGGIYTVTAKNQLNCVASKTISISLFSLTVVSASATSQTVCAKETLTLSASGANTYTWLPAFSIGANYTISPQATTKYTVTAHDLNGCKGADSLQVVVDKCTGIQNNVLRSALVKVYPNPSAGEFNIEMPFDGAKRIIAYSLTGAKVAEFTTEDQIFSFDLRGLTKGLYFIEIAAGSEQIRLKALVE